MRPVTRGPLIGQRCACLAHAGEARFSLPRHSKLRRRIAMDTTQRHRPVPTAQRESNAYSIFILVLTVFALAIMVLLLLPLDEATDTALLFYDNLICVVFLVDFAVNLANSHPEARLLHHAARLARPPRLDPRLRVLPSRRSAPPCTHQPAAARDAPAQPEQSAGLDQRPPPQPQPVRTLHHRPVGLRRPLRLNDPGRPVREPFHRREHHDRRRCPLVGLRDDHDRRVRRSVPRDHAGARASGCS